MHRGLGEDHVGIPDAESPCVRFAVLLDCFSFRGPLSGTFRDSCVE